MVGLAGILGELNLSYNEAVGALPHRLVITLSILATIYILVSELLPVVIRGSLQAVRKQCDNEEYHPYVHRFIEATPVVFSEFLLVRVYQTLTVISTTIILVWIWGRGDLVIFTVTSILDLVPEIRRVFLAIAIAGGGYIVSNVFTDSVQQMNETSNRLTDHQVEVICRSVQLFMAVVTIGLISSVWGIDLGNVILGAGFLGVIVGLAARETLASVLAGFILMGSRPFTIGDWVEIGQERGVVTEITIMNTRLRDADGNEIVVPNDTVGNKLVTNFSSEGRMRVTVSVGVSYDTDLDRACEIAADALANTDIVENAPSPEVIPNEFSDSAVTLEARFWVSRPSERRRARATADAVAALKTAFDEHDITIPFPQRNVTYTTHESGARSESSPEQFSQR